MKNDLGMNSLIEYEAGIKEGKCGELVDVRSIYLLYSFVGLPFISCVGTPDMNILSFHIFPFTFWFKCLLLCSRLVSESTHQISLDPL